MQLDSLARLRHLGEIATARRLALRDLTDRLRTLRDERRRALQRIDNLNEGREYTDRNGVEKEVTRLESRVADLDDAIADLSHREQDANAAWQEAKRLDTRCREFARENGLPVPEQVIGDAEGYAGARMPDGLGMVHQGGAQ